MQDQLGSAGYPKEDNYVLYVGPLATGEKTEKLKNSKTLSRNNL